MQYESVQVHVNSAHKTQHKAHSAEYNRANPSTTEWQGVDTIPDVRLLSTLNLIEPDLMDFGFNGLCLLADNQPRSRLKSVNVKESPVGGGRVGNIIR